jgi:soluble lytic murein transglycosylase-like protein
MYSGVQKISLGLIAIVLTLSCTLAHASPPRIGNLHLPPEYWEAMVEAGRDYGVDPALIAAVAAIESRFNPAATSGRGRCIGLMQLDRDTARALNVDPWDPRENIRGGAQVLARLLRRSGGNLTRALKRYNASWNPKYDREVRRAWRQARSQKGGLKWPDR